jgi:DNA-binding IclR family transcriptional regulator
MVAASRLDILEHAKPYVAQLVEETGETAHLGVLRQGRVVSLVNVESRCTVRTPATVGRHVPLHCTSQGKAILAFLSPDQLAHQLKDYVFTRHGPNTIVTQDRFLAELALVASRGYAVDNEEYEEGLRCIAAPVRDHSGGVVGAISIAGPTFRVSGSRLPALSRQVMRVAAGLSTALGYRGNAAQRRDSQ